MMTQWVRNLAFDIHKWSGIATFLILIVAAASGCVLTFRQPLDARLNPELFAVAPAAETARALSMPDLVDHVQAQRRDLRVTLALALPIDGRASVLEVAPSRPGAKLGFSQVFADPYSGRILGVREQRAGWDRPHLLQGVYELHAHLLAGPAGRVFLGAVSGVWLFSSLLGAYLTLPRGRPFWPRWRRQWSVAWAARLPKVMLDLHRASGLWLFLGVVAVSASGLLLNFYNELSEPLANAVSPPRFEEPAPRASPLVAAGLGYGEALHIAEAAAQTDGRPLKVAVAGFDRRKGLFRVGLTASGARDYWWLGPIYYYIDAETGRVVARDDPYRDSAGRRVLRALFPLHSGRMFGWTSRLYVFATGLGTGLMAVSGLYVWLRKRSARFLSSGATAPQPAN